MSNEEHFKRKISFNQIPSRQRTSLEAQLPKGSKAKSVSSLLILVVLLLIVYNTLFDNNNNISSKPQNPTPIQIQQSTQEKGSPTEENKKSVPELGKNWIKDSNEVYLWNPKPMAGESITWSGGYIQDGDYRYADGTGITTWYLNGKVEQVDEGTFKHGQRHGHFTHKFFPSGKIIHTNWNNGIEITESQPTANDDATVAQQTFINYHRAITNKNYRQAYSMLSYKQRERVGDFDSYVIRFADTISSEVSDLNLVASDKDSFTFNYTLTAHDRYHNGRIKTQVFKGQVTIAKDNDNWFIRQAKSNKIDEIIE